MTLRNIDSRSARLLAGTVKGVRDTTLTDTHSNMFKALERKSIKREYTKTLILGSLVDIEERKDQAFYFSICDIGAVCRRHGHIA